MSKNLEQIFIANPITSIASGDLLYVGQGGTTDAAINGTNLSAQFGVTPAALTSGSDTNVTLTLGGTPTTALLQAASVTAGWTGTLAGSRGGLGAAITANNGGIYYSNATTGALLSGTATANQVLLSGASTTPAWSTATYPATAGTSGNVLTSNGTNFVSSAPTGWTVLAVTVYTSSTNSFTPNTNTTYVKAILVGGGGGGGGCASANASASGGGGAGGYCELTMTKATLIGAGSQAQVVIGPGGGGGSAGDNPGTAGTASTLKANNGSGATLLTANGGGAGNAGAGGSVSDGAAGVAGGSASGGDVNITGGSGTGSFSLSVANTVGLAGNGGSNPLGFGGAGGALSAAGHRTAIAATGYGAGGAGETNTSSATAGLTGTGGICILVEYRTS